MYRSVTEGIRRYQTVSEGIGVYQKASDGIRGYPKVSECTRRHRTASGGIKPCVSENKLRVCRIRFCIKLPQSRPLY